MLTKELRLSRAEFKGLVKPLKTIAGDVLLLRIFRLVEHNASKYAVSVSKKQEKKAVVRNFIRRAVYRAIKNKLDVFKNGFAYHFIFKNKPKDIKNDITKDINHLLSKI